MNFPSISILVGDAGHYYLSGALVRDTVPSFWRSKQSWMPKDEQVVLDLLKLERIDSAGMAMLLHLKHHLKLNQQILTISHIPSQLRLLLTLSNVSEQLLEVPSTDGE